MVRYTSSMTQTQTREALRANDEGLAMELLQQIIDAKDVDAAAALLERIQVAERANTVEDVKIDLADFGETAAVEIIESNY